MEPLGKSNLVHYTLKRFIKNTLAFNYSLITRPFFKRSLPKSNHFHIFILCIYLLSFSKINYRKLSSGQAKKPLLVMWLVWLVEISLHDIQNIFPGWGIIHAKFEGIPQSGCRAIAKRKCRAGGAAWRSQRHLPREFLPCANKRPSRD